MNALFSKTGLGLLMALLLVLLFYARMLSETQDVLAKASQQAASKKATEQATKATEAQWRQALVGALRELKTPAAKSSPPDTSRNTLKTKQAQIGLTPDGIAGPRTLAALTPAQRPQNRKADTTTKPVAAAPTHWAGWLLLLGLGVGAYVGYQGWRESQATPVEVDPHDHDTILLEALMGAFAGAIGRALPVPRQVKRFASKARLQHNLLHQLAHETQSTLKFEFGVAQQVLAFLLLLLLEGHAATPGDQRHAQLRELGEGAFTEGLRERFQAWHRAAPDQKMYASFAQSPAAPGAPAYANLLDELDTAAADRLFIQLYRLNAGLLV